MKEKKVLGLLLAVLFIMSVPATVFAGGNSEGSGAAAEVSMIHFMTPNYNTGDSNDKAFAVSLEDYKRIIPM